MTLPPLNRLLTPTSNRSLTQPASIYQPKPYEEELKLITHRLKNTVQNHLYNHTSDDGNQTLYNQTSPSESASVYMVEKEEVNTESI
jgi:hypothetical protein